MGYYTKKVPRGRVSNLKQFQGMSTDSFSEGSCQLAQGMDKIRQDIQTLFRISKREFFFNPTIGCNLREYLFEQNDFLLRDVLTRVVTNEIESNIPNVKVTSVEVYQEDVSVSIYVSYDVLSLGQNDKIVIYQYVQETMDL